MLLRLDMQSDPSPHFLRAPQERPMYAPRPRPRTPRSPCEASLGPRREPSEIGSPTSTRNPMADWQMREKRPLRGPRPKPLASIVGIDEVDLDRGYISWRSPLANALMKASPGDRVNLRAPAKTEHLEIIEVEYAPIPTDPFREPLGAQSTPKVERS